MVQTNENLTSNDDEVQKIVSDAKTKKIILTSLLPIKNYLDKKAH